MPLLFRLSLLLLFLCSPSLSLLFIFSYMTRLDRGTSHEFCQSFFFPSPYPSFFHHKSSHLSFTIWGGGRENRKNKIRLKIIIISIFLGSLFSSLVFWFPILYFFFFLVLFSLSFQFFFILFFLCKFPPCSFFLLLSFIQFSFFLIVLFIFLFYA